MGEIATWSAVKTKVGLGKDGNDCPTKAELLALTPTGTGESYVGLEISNASSYGNNECVKLEDIHKVTYKYTFTAINTSFTFPAIGGESTPARIGLTSTKQKYWDGVAQGSSVTVGYTGTTLPDWLKESTDTMGFIATENLALSSRAHTRTYTQDESGKTVSATFTQAAASQSSWSYGWSVTPTSMSFGATGGTKTFSVTSYKQELRNGHNYGNQIALTYTRANSGSVSGSGTSVTMGNNTSTSTRSGTVTLTQAETGKKLTLSCSQSAGYRTYSEITASGGSVSDIPASGGSRSSFSGKPTYSQTWGWNGSTTGGGTITSGASIISYGTAVSAGSLGTTVKSRTQVGTLTGTLSLNGKTKSVSVPVYQAANEFTGYTYGSWSVSLTASSYTIGNTGGSVTLYPSASRPRYANYTSGSNTMDGSDSATPSLSTNGTSGFSLSGTTLSASANTSTSSRSIRVTASYGGVSDYVDITQSAAATTITYNYYFNWGSAPGSQTSKSITHPALGKTEEVPFISYKKKVINGTETSDIYPVGVVASRNIPSWTIVNIVDNGLSVKTYENTAESSRSATVTVTQSESGKEITLNITQSAATITYDYVFSINP